MKLSAFVARSFSSKDNPLWTKIMENLDALKSSTGWFDWEDGKPPESKEVEAKVQSRIDANKIFIGIFTRNKIMIPTEGGFSLWNSLFKRLSLNDLKWTTSNWVIQESGYALGKGRKLILLIEEGVDDFPSLQGNLEYIQFTRESIDAALSKLNLMAQAVYKEASQPVLTETTVQSVEPPVSPKETQSTKDNSEETKKTAEEETSTVYGKIFELIVDKADLEKAEVAYNQAVQAITLEEDKTTLGSWYHYLRFKVGRSDALPELKRIADSSAHFVPRKRLAQAYESFKQYETAAIEFLKARTVAPTIKIKVELTCEAVQCHKAAKKYNEAHDLISEALGWGELSDEERFVLYKEMGDVKKDQGISDWAFAFYEKALTYIPNAQLRFDLAYAYSQEGKHSLSMVHYNLYINWKEEAGVLNNLGVEYSHLNLNMKSVGCYEKASELGLTLAMANLADKYIESGFGRDAKTVLDKARIMDDPSPNIGTAMARLEEVRKEENDKKGQIEGSVRAEQTFMLEVSERLVDITNAIKINGAWETKFGRLTFKVDGNKLSGFEKTETKKTRDKSLYGLLLGKSSPQQEEYIETRQIELSGTLTGSAFRYKIKTSTSIPHSLLSGQNSETNGLGYFDNTKDVLVTIETQDGKTIRETVSRSPI